MRFDIMKVDATVAAEWLSKPWVRQRTVSPPVVAKYARAMQEGRWEEPSLDPIGFTPEGSLGNGQHRLHAVIRSGWSGDMLIALDVPEENFLVHDTGRHRLASQFIHSGHAKTVAAVARLVMWYDTAHPAPPRGRDAQFDNDVTLEFIDKNEKRLAEVADIADHVARTSGVPASVNGAVMFIASRGKVDPDLISSWAEGLGTGVGLAAGDPRLALRERLAKNPSIRRDQVLLWYLITYAFNAYAHGRPLSKLVIDTTDAPPVVKLSEFQMQARKYPRLASPRPNNGRTATVADSAKTN